MKYQGADGWLEGDGERPRRYKNKEVIGPEKSPHKPKEKMPDACCYVPGGIIIFIAICFLWKLGRWSFGG